MKVRKITQVTGVFGVTEINWILQNKAHSMGIQFLRSFNDSSKPKDFLNIIEDLSKRGNAVLPGSNKDLGYKGEIVKMPIDLGPNSTRFCKCPNTNKICEVPNRENLFSAGAAIGLKDEDIVKLSPQLMQVLSSVRMFTMLQAFYTQYESTRDKVFYSEFEQVVSTSKVANKWFLEYKHKQALETSFPDYVSECGFDIKTLEKYRVAYTAVREEQQAVAMRAEQLARKYRHDQEQNNLNLTDFLKSIKINENETVDLSQDKDFRIMLLKVGDLPFEHAVEAQYFIYPTISELNEVRTQLKKELCIEREPTDDELYRLKGVCVNKKFKLREILNKFQLKLRENLGELKIVDNELVFSKSTFENPEGSSLNDSQNSESRG